MTMSARADLAQGGEQYTHHQPGLEALPEPDQKVRYSVGPSHGN
jgi:hypothetical protein